MRLIRNKVFETNSSSCHSISITSDMELNDIPTPDEYGNLFIESGEFGWEQDEYNSWWGKAAYLIVYIRDWSGESQEKYKQLFEYVVKEVTGAETITYEELFWKTEEKSYEYEGVTRTYQSKLGEGYIDHQSVEDRDLDYMFEYVNEMKKFLFSSNSVLETDNDNH